MIRRLLTALGRDYVVLRNSVHGDHRVRPIRWECGVPFAAMYLAETASQLMPGGMLKGPCYVESWLPASPRMQRYFARLPQGDVGSPNLNKEA